MDKIGLHLMRSRGFLLSTTSISNPRPFTTLPWVQSWVSNEISKYENNASLSKEPSLYRRSLKTTEKQGRQEGAGVVFQTQLSCPMLSCQDIASLHTTSANFITRHFDRKYLAATASGYFRFGTVASYRSADRRQVGRFSDAEEASLWKSFQSDAGKLDSVQFNGNQINNISSSGVKHLVRVEYHVNEYCSCSSSGKFSHSRAMLLRDRGNPDVSAFVVYDLHKLRIAMLEIISEETSLKHLALIGRDVEYGVKDQHTIIEGRFLDPTEADQMSIWVRSIFIKSADYSHEEEVRLVLIDPNRVGLLDESIAEQVFMDDRIKDSIVDKGTF